MPVGIDKFWMQPNNVSPISPQAEDGGWSSVIVGDLTGISANTTYRFWYSYEGNYPNRSHLKVKIGSGASYVLFAGQDHDGNDVAPDDNKERAHYKYVDVTSGTANLGNLYIEQSQKYMWTGTLMMAAVTPTNISSGSGVITDVDNACMNENPYFHLEPGTWNYNPPSQTNKAGRDDIIHNWTINGNWKFVNTPHSSIHHSMLEYQENSNGNVGTPTWNNYAYWQMCGNSMLGASLFGANSPSGMRNKYWSHLSMSIDTEGYKEFRYGKTTQDTPLIQDTNTLNNSNYPALRSQRQSAGGYFGNTPGSGWGQKPWNTTRRSVGNQQETNSGLFGSGLILPSNSEDGAGDNYTQAWYYDNPTGRDSIVAEARPQQTWSIRCWVKNPNNTSVDFSLWLYFEDENAYFNHTGYSIGVADTTPGYINEGHTSWYKKITLSSNQDWTQVAFTVKAPDWSDAKWIQGVTSRIDNDKVSNTQYPLHIDGWSLWRRNVSMVELAYAGEYSKIMSDWDTSTYPESVGDEWIRTVIGGSESQLGGAVGYLDNPNWHIKLSELGSAPPAWDDTIFWFHPGMKMCYPIERDYTDITGQTSVTNDVRKARDLIGRKWCKGPSGSGGGSVDANFPIPDWYGGWAGVLRWDQHVAGINVEGDLGVHADGMTVSGWWYFPGSTNQETQYMCDGRNGSGDWFLFNYSSFNINIHDKLRYQWKTTSYNGENTPSSKWIHIVAASDSDGSRLYINGSDVTADCNRTQAFDRGIGNNFRIGTRYNHQNSFRGFSNSFRIFKKMLSPYEARWLFEHEKALCGRDNTIMDWDGLSNANISTEYKYKPEQDEVAPV